MGLVLSIAVGEYVDLSTPEGRDMRIHFHEVLTGRRVKLRFEGDREVTVMREGGQRGGKRPTAQERINETLELLDHLNADPDARGIVQLVRRQLTGEAVKA